MPRPVIIQPTFLVALLAGKSIPLRRLRLAAHSLIRRTSVGRIFLVGNDLRLVIQFEAGRAEMVAELIADHLPGRLVTASQIERARLYQSDALLVVHYVKRLAF